MNLGIFESGAHEQYLLAVCDVAIEQSEALTVFTTRDKYEKLAGAAPVEQLHIEWVLQEDDQSVSALLTAVQRRSTDLDALLYVSLYGKLRHFLQYARLDLRCPELLFIYNVNAWFSTSVSSNCGFRTNAMRLLRRRVRDRMDCLVVEYPQLQPFVTERHDWEKPVQAFPPVIYTESSNGADASSGHLVVSVPGNVQSERRDYEMLLDGMEPAFAAHPEKLELRLLGPPVGEYGRRIHKHCDRLRDRGFNVRTVNNRLGHSEFSDQMRDSDLLICPLRYSTVGGTGATEIYSISKGSGSVFDAIRYGVPAMFPEHFLVPGYIRSSSTYYRTASDITKTIDELVTEPSYAERLRSQAHDNAVAFTIDKQTERLISVLDSVQ